MSAVVQARLFAVALPLREPFTISGGTMAIRRSLIVELSDSEGNRGYGESAPFELPFYSSETFASARSCLVDLLLPSIIGRTVDRPETCRDHLDQLARGNRMAKAGVETAWWDLIAARQKTTLAELVSRRLAELGVGEAWRVQRGHLECGVALGIPPKADGKILAEWVRDAIGHRYRRIKIKIRPGWDEEPVRMTQETMREAGVTLPLWADANGAYHLGRDEQPLRALDRFGLLFLEQPLAEEAIQDSIALTRIIRTPVCFDESLVSDEIARQIVDAGGPSIWNIKIQRVGGLEEACRIYARATGSGVAVWSGTMPETGVGAQAMLALGGFAGFVYPSDIEPSERWYQDGSDLVPLRMERDGTMRIPTIRAIPDLSRALLVAEIG